MEQQGTIRKCILLSCMMLLLFFGAVPSVAFAQDRMPSSTHEESQVPGDLCTLQSVRRFLLDNSVYPREAAKNGLSGCVELYARINNHGRIDEVLELQPDRNFSSVDEIVISAGRPAGVEIAESTRHDLLVSEARRVIMSLPRLDMPELHGEILRFTFRFVLQ